MMTYLRNGYPKINNLRPLQRCLAIHNSHFYPSSEFGMGATECDQIGNTFARLCRGPL